MGKRQLDVIIIQSAVSHFEMIAVDSIYWGNIPFMSVSNPGEHTRTYSCAKCHATFQRFENFQVHVNHHKGKPDVKL